MHLLLLLMKQAARRMLSSFLAALCRLQSAYYLGALQKYFRNSLHIFKMEHFLELHTVRLRIELCSLACLSVSIRREATARSQQWYRRFFSSCSWQLFCYWNCCVSLYFETKSIMQQIACYPAQVSVSLHGYYEGRMDRHDVLSIGKIVLLQ